MISDKRLAQLCSEDECDIDEGASILINDMATELLKLRALADAVAWYIDSHHQRSDDPEFEALREAYDQASGGSA